MYPSIHELRLLGCVVWLGHRDNVLIEFGPIKTSYSIFQHVSIHELSRLFGCVVFGHHLFNFWYNRDNALIEFGPIRISSSIFKWHDGIDLHVSLYPRAETRTSVNPTSTFLFGRWIGLEEGGGDWDENYGDT